MAKVTPSPLVERLSGSVGGVTFSNWKGTSYVKSKARSVRNPATEDQVAIRDALTVFARRWFDVLTDAQRAAWDQYAQETASADRGDQVVGSLGVRVVPQRSFQRSGYNWFIGLNCRLVKQYGDTALSAPVDDAPLGVTPPSQVILRDCVYDNVTGKFTFGFRTPATFGGESHVMVSLWVLPNFAYARQQFSQEVDTPNAPSAPTDLTTLQIQNASLGLPLPDGVYRFQMDGVGKEHGLLCPPSEIITVKAAYVGA
jgi:hypothetical protein